MFSEITRFTDIAREYNKELEQQIAFIEKSAENPSMMFRDASNYLKNPHGPIFTAMQRNPEKSELHNFQSFIANIVIEFMEKWFEEEKIDERVTVKLRDHLRFPSIFSVYWKDIEIMQFDIYNRWYGSRDKWKTEAQIIEEFQTRRFARADRIERLNKDNEKWKEGILHPYKYIKEFHRTRLNKNVFLRTFWKLSDYLMLIFKKEKLISYFKKNIEQNDSQIRSAESEAIRDSLDCIVEKNIGAIETIERLTPLFKLYGYVHQTDRNKIY